MKLFDQSPRAKQGHALIVGIFSVIISFASTSILAQSLEDLLQEADQALKPSAPKAKSEPTKDQAVPKKTNTKREAIPSNQTEPAAETNAPKSPEMLTPIDGSSVNELMGLSVIQRSELIANEGDVMLGVGLAATQLRGEFESSKDDDYFRVKADPNLFGARVWYAADFLTKLNRNFGSVRVGPHYRAAAGFFRGDIEVERSGVFNDQLPVTFQVAAADGSVGFFVRPANRWKFFAGFGLGVDAVIQTGTGNSDSTSGFGWTDSFDINAAYDFSNHFGIGSSYSRRGLLRPIDQRDEYVLSSFMRLRG